MNYIKLIILFVFVNFYRSSSFKKGIYGSMVSIKYKLAIEILRRNYKNLDLSDLTNYKNLLNQNQLATKKIYDELNTYIPQSFVDQQQRMGVKLKGLYQRMGQVLLEMRHLKDLEIDDNTIDNHAFKTDNNFDPVQAFYDQYYLFYTKLCPSYLSKFALFRESVKLVNYFCYRFSTKLRQNEFFMNFVQVAIDFFGWTLVMSVEKYKSELEELFNKIPMHFNIFNYQDHQDIQLQFYGFMARFHKIIDSVFKTFIKIQYKKMRTFDKIAQYLILKNPNLQNRVQNIFLILYNIDFHNSEFVETMDYLNYLEQIIHQEESTFRGSIYNVSKTFVIDKFLITEKHSECTFHQTYVYNRYLLDCGQILRKKNPNNIIIGTCKLYYKKFFSQLKKFPQFCYFIKGNWIWWRGLMDKLHIDLSNIANKNEEINVTQISQNLLSEAVERYSSMKKQIQKLTGLSYINKKLFTYFSYFEQMIYEPEFENIIASSYRKFMINIEKYNTFDNNMMQVIKKDEQKFIDILNFREKQIDKIKNDMINQLIYNCMIMSPLQFISICKKIFYGINLDFYLQFDQLYFIYIFLNKYITNEFQKYNFYQNDSSQMIAYFRKKFQNFLINIEKTLFRIIKNFDKDIIEKIGQQKLFAVYMMYLNLKPQENINFAQIAFDLQETLRKGKNIKKLTKYDIESQDFDAKLAELAKEYYEDSKDKIYFPIRYDIFFIFIQQSSKLTEDEMEEFKENKEFLFLHFNQWNKEMKNMFTENGQLVSKQPYIQCKKNNPSLDCQKNSLTLSIYTNKCPENSVRLNASNCVQKCPENFKQQGIFCMKPEIYVRKVYDNIKDCGKECIVYDREYWIRPCSNSYEELLLFCIPKCPMGSEDYGKTCKRKFIEKIKVYFQLIQIQISKQKFQIQNLFKTKQLFFSWLHLHFFYNLFSSQ